MRGIAAPKPRKGALWSGRDDLCFGGSVAAFSSARKDFPSFANIHPKPLFKRVFEGRKCPKFLSPNATRMPKFLGL
jgi:hypothetical protein